MPASTRYAMTVPRAAYAAPISAVRRVCASNVQPSAFATTATTATPIAIRSPCSTIRPQRRRSSAGAAYLRTSHNAPAAMTTPSASVRKRKPVEDSKNRSNSTDSATSTSTACRLRFTSATRERGISRYNGTMASSPSTWNTVKEAPGCRGSDRRMASTAAAETGRASVSAAACRAGSSTPGSCSRRVRRRTATSRRNRKTSTCNNTRSASSCNRPRTARHSSRHAPLRSPRSGSIFHASGDHRGGAVRTRSRARTPSSASATSRRTPLMPERASSICWSRPSSQSRCRRIRASTSLAEARTASMRSTMPSDTGGSATSASRVRFHVWRKTATSA